MTQAPFLSLREHPAFRGISEASVSILERRCKALRYELGGQLCDPNDIPARFS